MRGLRLGILGGTFNPVHIGHVRLALEAAERLGLDRVDLVPAAQPPHKADEAILPYELRCRLIQHALPGSGRLGLSELEGVLAGPSYTFHTLTEYRRILPGADIFFILGASDLRSMPGWMRGLELPGLAHLAVGTRGNGPEEAEAFLRTYFPGSPRLDDGSWLLPGGNRLLFFDAPRIEISGTMIRDRWRRGSSLDCLLPDAVLRELLACACLVDDLWGPRPVCPRLKSP